MIRAILAATMATLAATAASAGECEVALRGYFGSVTVVAEGLDPVAVASTGSTSYVPAIGMAGGEATPTPAAVMTGIAGSMAISAGADGQPVGSGPPDRLEARRHGQVLHGARIVRPSRGGAGDPGSGQAMPEALTIAARNL